MAFFDNLKIISDMIFSTFLSIFDFITLPANDFLDTYSSGFSNFLIDLIDFVGFSNFFDNISFGGIVLGSMLPIILVILLIYLFIP